MKKISKLNYFELAVFLMDYHSGQWSRGYRILSRLKINGNWPQHFLEEMRETDCYQYLVENYANSV